MPQGAGSLLVVALVAASLGGCLAPEAGRTLEQGIPTDLRMAGAEVEEQTRTSLTWRWEGEARPATAGVSARAVPGQLVSTTFDVPAGYALLVKGALTWDDPATRLVLTIRDASGLGRCVPRGEPDEPESRCHADILRPAEADEVWTVEVVSVEAPTAATPFEVRLRLALPSRPPIAPLASRFAEPILLGVGGDSLASLAIGPDGVLLACSHGALRQPSPLWASEDGGRTWRELTIQLQPLPNGNCDVAVAEDGTWYVAYGTPASVAVAASPDRGVTWTMTRLAALPAGGIDRHWIFTEKEIPMLVYANVMDTEPAVHMFARSVDGGATWLEQRVIGTASDPARLTKFLGHPIVYDDGQTLRAPLATYGAAGQVAETWFELATSRDGGRSWVVEEVAGPFEAERQFATLARSGDGTLWLAATVANDTRSDVVVFRSADDGETWSDPIVVAAGQTLSGLDTAWIDGRPDGSATLAWLGFTERMDDASGWQLHVARVDSAVPGFVAFSAPATPPTTVPQEFEYAMVRHDPSGRAQIAFPMGGPGCEDDPSSARSRQCILFLREGGDGVSRIDGTSADSGAALLRG